MSLLAYGVNFRTAEIDLRERIAVPEETLAKTVVVLRQKVDSVSEVTILSTCNRTEIYCWLDDPSLDPIIDWITNDRNISAEELDRSAYSLWDKDAACHAMRVAAGLDSQVLGEPQIMGQMKVAYDVARSAGTIGRELNLLSQFVFNVAKRVRTETNIGRNPVSVAYAAVTMARQIFANFNTTNALLVGAGETIELVARHLKEAGVRKIGIANRTLDNARALADKIGGTAMPLDHLGTNLGNYDVVISSTGSALPIITKPMVEQAVIERRHRPMFMVDIAVPRDIDPEVSNVDDVFLYSIDDLTEIIEENSANRRQAAASAEKIVKDGAQKFTREQRLRDSQTLLRQFRENADTLCQEEIESALQRLSNGQDSKAVISRLARDLSNKLIHAPTMAIRNASADGRTDLLEYLRSLYDLG